MAGPMTVKQTGDTLTVEREGRNGVQTTTYKLDGSESRRCRWARRRRRSRAKWDGSKLVITTKTDQGEQTQTWSLAGGALTIERTGGRGAVEDDLQEDHLVRSSKLVELESARGRRASCFRPFLYRRPLRTGCPTAARSSSPTVRPDDRVPQIAAHFRERPEHEEAGRNRGCGTVRPSSSTTSSPARIRSRSRVRGAPGYGRSRPKSRSIRGSASSSCACGEVGLADDGGVEIQRLVFETGAFGIGVDEGGNLEVGEEAREPFDGEGQGGVAVAEVAAQRDSDPPARRVRHAALLDPARRQDSPARARAVGAPAEKVAAAGQRLVEEAAMLRSLAEDHAQHRPMAGVAQAVDARPPLVDESLRAVAILLEDRRLDLRTLAVRRSAPAPERRAARPPMSVTASRSQLS